MVCGEHFLAIKQWEPYFKASEAKLSSVAMWVTLPKLPIEFYDATVLREIRSAIGPVLRIDSYTASKSRGSYARLCVQVDLEKPLITSVRVGRLVQKVTYEGVSTLCFQYGRLGHKQDSCPYHIKPVVREGNVAIEPISSRQQGTSQVETTQSEPNYGPWMVVTRRKNPNRAGRSRGPNNPNQGNTFVSKGKPNFLEPISKGNEGKFTRLFESRYVEDLATSNVCVLSADNSQKKISAADVNDIEICQEVLSSGNAVCSEKSQNFTGMDGISNKTHQKHKAKSNKSLGIKNTKSLNASKIQKCLVSSLGGKSEFVGSDELENGRNFIGNESNTSVRLGHMVSKQDCGNTRRDDCTNQGHSAGEAGLV